jgi:hypothetical protein
MTARKEGRGMSNYKEPWKAIGNHKGEPPFFDNIFDCDGRILVGCVDTEEGKRIATCVNACAGMADPEKEIAEMKEMIYRLFYEGKFVGSVGDDNFIAEIAQRYLISIGRI